MKILTFLIAIIATIYANDPYANVKYEKLSNGLQVYMLSDSKASQTTVSLEVKDGTIAENRQNTGIAHLTEHMIFRDSSLKYKDYLDFFEKEGADCNGFTSSRKVRYYITLDANKSYWALKNFYKMIFKKNWNQKDLQIERKAVLNEIGEPHWWDSAVAITAEFFKKITPPSKSSFRELFNASKSKENPPKYLQNINTIKFTLKDVIKHYNDFYYPENMVLKVAGNFDEEKMRQLIKSTFGTVKRVGSKTIEPIKKDAKLKKIPYHLLEPGVTKNRAILGGRYIVKDYKTFLINQIYIIHLGERLQRILRNNQGKSYSIYGASYHYKKGGIAYVKIDGLHKDFKNNIKIALATINKDAKSLDKKVYNEAMSEYKKRYFEAVEHDTDTLMGLINSIKYIKENTNTPNETPYSIFTKITPQEFQKTIANTFKEENRYSKIMQDYILFPYEALVVLLVSLYVVILLLKYYTKVKLKELNIYFTKDDIMLQRRVTSRFVSFFIVGFMVILTVLVWGWIKYLLLETSDVIKYKLISLPLWAQYILSPVDLTIFMILFVLLFAIIFKNYTVNLFTTSDRLYLRGSRTNSFSKDSIKSLSISKYSPKLFNKIKGVMLRFWKPLIKLELQNGTIHYIRSDNPVKLKQILENWLNSR